MESQLQLTEDGQSLPLQIEPIVNGSVGFLILIDSSESMAGLGNKWKLALAKATVARLLAELRPGDGASLMEFNQTVRPLVPFSRDGQMLQGSLSRIELGGGTALYDTVVYASQLVRRLPTKKKVMVLISDGYEQRSTATMEEALAIASRRAVPTIVLDFRHGVEDLFLRTLAHNTKGVYRHLVDLKDSISGLAYLKLANAYRISYSSPRTEPDGSMRLLEVTLSNDALLASASHRYRAPSFAPVGCAPSAPMANGLLEIGSIEIMPGQIARVPIQLRDLPQDGAAMFDVTIDFDPTVTRILAVEQGENTTSFSAIEPDNIVGRARFTGTLSAEKKNAVLAFLNLAASGPGGRQTELLPTQVRLTSSDGNRVALFTVKGILKIIGTKLGDVNDDGSVNLADAYRIAGYVSGFIHADELNLNVADTTRDGAITMDDAWAIVLDKVEN
jgi:hypothetical protein